MKRLFSLTVIYNKKVDESPTFIELKEIIKSDENLNKIFIFDNSTLEETRIYNEKYISSMENEKIVYLTKHENIGLAKAYNQILGLITNNKNLNHKDWLLITDQDSVIKKEMFDLFNKKFDSDNSIGAYIPRMIGKNHLISPLKVNNTKFGDSFDLPDYIPVGILSNRYTAINSCSFFSIDALVSIGGFNELFPIDYLDHYTYYLLFEKNYKLFCLDIDIHHDLSFENFNVVNYQRYKGFLKAQILYIYQHNNYNRRLRVNALLHSFKMHAKRTLKNMRIIHFVKGSCLYFSVYIQGEQR